MTSRPLSTVRTEVRLLLGRFGLLLAAVASLSAAAVVVAPVLVHGENQSSGAAAAVVAAGYAGAAAVLIGPALVVGGIGRDFERGTREARFLAGLPGRRLASCQLLAAVACVTGMIGLAAVLGAAGGLADLLVGWATGRDPETASLPPGSFSTALLSAAAALGAVVLTWLLVLACRSARGAVLSWMALLLTLLVPLLRAEGDTRAVMAGHPLASLWAAVDPFAASSLTIMPTPYSWLSTALGIACLACFARVGLRRY